MNLESVNLCRHCGTRNVPSAIRCWRCGYDLQPIDQATDIEALPDLPPLPRLPSPESTATFSLTTTFLILTLFCVGFGLFAIAPGLGILMAIGAMPALVRTTLVALRRRQLGREVSTARKIALFAGSLATTIVMAVVVIIAAIGSFCAVCLAAATDTAIPVAAVVGIGAGLFVAFLFALVIRTRWKHDVNAE